jgi:Sec-independent protein translocase protein TatA
MYEFGWAELIIVGIIALIVLATRYNDFGS